VRVNIFYNQIITYQIVILFPFLKKFIFRFNYRCFYFVIIPANIFFLKTFIRRIENANSVIIKRLIYAINKYNIEYGRIKLINQYYREVFLKKEKEKE